ncbi:MAG: hypothetical protein RIA69_14385 [Cyclobacteriaceae bacterium]
MSIQPKYVSGLQVAIKLLNSSSQESQENQNEIIEEIQLFAKIGKFWQGRESLNECNLGFANILEKVGDLDYGISK